MPRSRAAAPYDRWSSVINRSGTKPYLFNSFACASLRHAGPVRLDQDIEDLTLGVDGAPQVDHAAVDLEIDLIEVSARVGSRSAFAQVRGDHRPEMDNPAPNGLVGSRNAAFCQQVLDVTQAQGEPKVEPDRLLDDLAWEPVTTVADSLHPVGYRAVMGTATARMT
jgi:hypothetical protein